MTFRVGQKVVCVDPVNDLVHGRIYTVLGTGVCKKGSQMIDVDQTRCLPIGAQFFAFRFRPIVSRKTDISALKALLVPGAKIREDA